MGSGYYGQPNLGSDQRSSSTSGSSRKGSKKGNSDKPKQPQRGLGVAQLEKIRLHSQMGASSYLPSLQTNPYGATHNFSQEDVRMQTAYSSSSSFSYSTPSSTSYGFPAAHQNTSMGYGDYEGITHIRYGDSQPTTTTRWPPGNTFLDYSQQCAQPGTTRQLLDLQAEESYGKRKKKHGSESSSQNSESSGNQDLDLELRLSL